MYIYNDEDNAPMIDRDGHNPTIYKDGAEMRLFDIPEKPDDGCWNCCQYDGERCHKCWNNNKEEYYLPDRDNKAPDEICDDWQEETGVDWKTYFIDFGGNEP